MSINTKISASDSFVKELEIAFKENIPTTSLYKKLNESSKEEELILFISFDLVNSTEYKSRNYTSWFSVLIEITERIKALVLQNIEKSQLWRSIGDEIIFIVNITSEEQLKKAVQSAFFILNEVIKEIKNGSILSNAGFGEEEVSVFRSQNVLSLKSTAWIASVHRTSNYKNNNTGVQNLMYIYNNGNDEGLPTYEFQGNDIDTGFRISKYTRNRRLTLSIELAYLLSKDQLIDSKINIITYTKLKGIWDNKMYPVIWYHDYECVGCKLDESFNYDEYYIDDITREYIDNKYCGILLGDNITTFKKLWKIICDNNMFKKVEGLEESLKKLKDSKMLIEGKKLLEVHCVALCVDFNKEEILFFKRKDDTTLYKGKWDFGCCEIKSGQSFKENLEKDYKNKFGISINVLDPIKEYSFIDNNKKTIPGIRFIAKVIDRNNIYINSDEYEKGSIKWIKIDEFEQCKEEEQEDFINYKEFLEVIKSIKKYLEVEKSNE